jgi:hypothetical protein
MIRSLNRNLELKSKRTIALETGDSQVNLAPHRAFAQRQIDHCRRRRELRRSVERAIPVVVETVEDLETVAPSKGFRKRDRLAAALVQEDDGDAARDDEGDP